MATSFVNKGVAVIVGEYGAYPKEKYPEMNYLVIFQVVRVSTTSARSIRQLAQRST